jgi:hypothetical protein
MLLPEAHAVNKIATQDMSEAEVAMFRALLQRARASFPVAD